MSVNRKRLHYPKIIMCPQLANQTPDRLSIVAMMAIRVTCMVEANSNVLPIAEKGLDIGDQGLGKRKRNVKGRGRAIFRTCIQSQTREKKCSSYYCM